MCTDGDTLFTASGRRTMAWSLRTGEHLRDQWVGPGDAVVQCMVVTGGVLFVGTTCHPLTRQPLHAYVATTYTHALAGKLYGHRKSVTCLAAGAGVLYSGSTDSTVRVWDAATGECTQVLEGHRDRVNCVAVSKNGVVYSGAGDCTARAWDASTGAQLRVFQGHPNAVQCLALHDAGGLLVTGAFCEESSCDDSDGTDDGGGDGGGGGGGEGSACGNETLRVFEVSGGALVRTVGGHAGTVWAMAVADCVVYASVGEPRGNRICAHHLLTGALLRVLEGPQARLPQQAARFWAVARWARCLLVDSAGGRRRVLAGCNDRTLRAHAAVTLVWSPAAHAMLPLDCRRRVYTLLLVRARGAARGGSALPLWRLAQGVFFLILSMLPIHGFARST
eukprot:g4608.t1